MGDRQKLFRFGQSVVATAVVVAALQAPSLAQSTPPPFQQIVHSFDISQPEATAYSLWNSGDSQRHEVWFRVLGGDADYQQRLRVYKEQAPPRSPDTLPPVSEIVFEMEDNTSSEWVFLGSENSFYTYYFDGDNRPVGASWDHAQAVRVRKTIYSNGDRYEISFEDLDTLDDYNDLEIEVVLIRR